MDVVTERVAQELLSHEGIVPEAYKDIKGVWTWSVGLTAASGYNIMQYKDNPQSLEVCLQAYLAVLNARYVPPVKKAFGATVLTEAQFGAALSFHYNTGAIGKASWVKLWLAGNVAAAKAAILNWDAPPSVMTRRKEEQNLFFNGVWSSNGTALLYSVAKPSYAAVNPQRVNVATTLQQLLGSG